MKMCLSYVCLNSLMPVPAVNGRDTCWSLFHFWLHHLWPKLVSLIKPAKHSNHKQVICQAKDKFWPDKKSVWSDKLKIRDIETLSFGISFYSLCQNAGCKFKWLKVDSTECKINTGTRKETFRLSQVLFYLLKIDKLINVCIPSLPSLTWSHVYSVFSRISSFPMSKENHGKNDETVSSMDSLWV